MGRYMLTWHNGVLFFAICLRQAHDTWAVREAVVSVDLLTCSAESYVFTWKDFDWLLYDSAVVEEGIWSVDYGFRGRAEPLISDDQKLFS